MNPSRIWLERDLATFAASIPPGSKILDAGSGNQPYKALFSNHVYETADFEKVDKTYQASTYVCDLAHIPTEDQTFDAIIFTQVMEHLPDPTAVIHELLRVLKPGGYLFYSGPLFYEEHEVPYDFFRYTQYGVRHLFTSVGFTIEDIHWLEGYMGTLTYLLNRLAKHMPLDPRALGGGPRAWLLVALFSVSKPMFKLVARLAAECDIRQRYTKRGFPINYVALARKPDGSPTR
jgi:SAM-dependent methyltransferase